MSAHNYGLFYLQDSRKTVGNDVLWWAIDDRGYTTDLRKAETYSEEAAYRQHAMRVTDIAWPKAYIDSIARPCVDFQSLNRAMLEERKK
jgi:hypothetical protein